MVSGVGSAFLLPLPTKDLLLDWEEEQLADSSTGTASKGLWEVTTPGSSQDSSHCWLAREALSNCVRMCVSAGNAGLRRADAVGSSNAFVQDQHSHSVGSIVVSACA